MQLSAVCLQQSKRMNLTFAPPACWTRLHFATWQPSREMLDVICTYVYLLLPLLLVLPLAGAQVPRQDDQHHRGDCAGGFCGSASI
jgi:hypothetical protein